MTVKKFTSDTRYLRTVWFMSSDKAAVESAAESYSHSFPYMGYGTSVKPVAWHETDREWCVQVTHAHHCD